MADNLHAVLSSVQVKDAADTEWLCLELCGIAAPIGQVGVSVLNGLIWGGVVGLFAFLIYPNWQFGAVMTGAMVLSLLLAAIMGVTIPLVMHKLGRDPALSLRRSQRLGTRRVGERSL
jgi:hypothetical protein